MTIKELMTNLYPLADYMVQQINDFEERMSDAGARFHVSHNNIHYGKIKTKWRLYKKARLGKKIHWQELNRQNRVKVFLALPQLEFKIRSIIEQIIKTIEENQ